MYKNRKKKLFFSCSPSSFKIQIYKWIWWTYVYFIPTFNCPSSRYRINCKSTTVYSSTKLCSSKNPRIYSSSTSRTFSTSGNFPTTWGIRSTSRRSSSTTRRICSTPPPEEVPQPPEEYVPPPEEVPQPPEEVPQPPEEYVPPPEEVPQPPEEVPQPPEEVPQPPEEVPPQYVENPQPPEYLPPVQPEIIPPPKLKSPPAYVPPPPKPYVPPTQKPYVPPQPKKQPYIPPPKPPEAKNLKVGQYISAQTYTAPKTNTYAIPNTDSLKGVKAVYDPSYNANTSSYNPLIDKKIVKTTLIPDSHRTPWDAPVYKEKVKTGPRYSKIDSVYEIPYVKYPPPYKSGDFFTRLRICVARKKNLAGTLKDLTKRYNDLMVYLNRDMDRIFAGSPSYNDKMYLKDLITKMLCTYHESRDIEHYDDIFKKEVEAKQLKFYGREKEEYDEAMKTLIGTFPYKLAIEYSKINDNFRKIIAKFFLEKNLRFYKKEEIEDVNIYQQRLMFKTN